MGQQISSTPVVPVVVVDASDAWGYHSPQDFGELGAESGFRNYIYLHNGLNIGSIFFSPLAGVIRVITALFLLANIGKLDQAHARFDVDATKRFLKMQVGRGAMELFCLGPILGTVVDGTMTCKHKKLLSFAESLSD